MRALHCIDVARLWRALVATLLVTVAGPIWSAELDPTLIERAEALLGEAQPSAAYELLKSRETEFAGNPRFDYLLGLTAVDAGRPADAVVPFKRVLAVEPRFAGARFELAKALHGSGDLVAAETLFRELLAEGPSPATRAEIENYLTAISQSAALRPNTAQFAWFLDAGAGYDSNANLSTSDTQFFGFALNPQFVATESPFAELGVGANWSRLLSGDRALNAYGRLTHRANTDASFVDQSVGLLGANYYFKLGQLRASVGVNGFNGWLDGEQHQRSANIEFGLSRLFAGKWELAGLVRSGQLVFEQRDLQPLDVDRYLGGLAITRLGIGKREGRFGVAVVGGQDETRRIGSPFGNQKIGLRAFAALAPRAGRLLYGEALYLDTDYSRVGFFGRLRQDEQFLVFAGLDIQNWPRKSWTVSPQLRFTDNRSTVALFDYDRVEAMVFVRRVFD